MTADLNALTQEIASKRLSTPVGRVTGISGGVVEISGLGTAARIGDRLVLKRQDGDQLSGEVMMINTIYISMLPDVAPNKVAINDPVLLYPTPDFAPDDRWIGLSLIHI